MNSQKMTPVLKNKISKSAFSDEKLLEITDIIMKKLVKNKSINYTDFDEVRQSVLEKYFSKKDSIIGAYVGKSKPETYLSAVIYKTALGVMRNQRNFNKYQSDDDPEDRLSGKQNVINPEEQLIIEDEIRYLEKVLLTLPERRKAIVFLKCYYRLSVSNGELTKYAGKVLLNGCLKAFSDNEHLTDKELYNALCETENSIREKKVKPDAVRMYINKITDTVLDRLNGRSQRAFYDKEALGILFEKLCSNADYDLNH